MGDAKRRQDAAQKIMNEMFGKLPTADSIAALIREANYEKILLVFQDVQAEHGDMVANLLMKQVETMFPEEYKRYKAQLESAKAIILEAHERAVQKLNNLAHGFVDADYQVLLAHPLQQSSLNYVVKKFFGPGSFIDIEAFGRYIDEATVLPAGLPDSWPDGLKLAYVYEPLEAYFQQVYFNMPESMQQEDNVPLIMQSLASGLLQAYWKEKQNGQKK